VTRRYGHSLGQLVALSPGSQKPLPQTATHAPSAPSSQQSFAHAAGSSPASQKPLPHAGRHDPDASSSQQSLAHAA